MSKITLYRFAQHEAEDDEGNVWVAFWASPSDDCDNCHRKLTTDTGWECDNDEQWIYCEHCVDLDDSRMD